MVISYIKSLSKLLHRGMFQMDYKDFLFTILQLLCFLNRTQVLQESPCKTSLPQKDSVNLQIHLRKFQVHPKLFISSLHKSNRMSVSLSAELNRYGSPLQCSYSCLAKVYNYFGGGYHHTPKRNQIYTISPFRIFLFKTKI